MTIPGYKSTLTTGPLQKTKSYTKTWFKILRYIASINYIGLIHLYIQLNSLWIHVCTHTTKHSYTHIHTTHTCTHTDTHTHTWHNNTHAFTHSTIHELIPIIYTHMRIDSCVTKCKLCHKKTKYFIYNRLNFTWKIKKKWKIG